MTVDGRPLRHVVVHSPTGFCWGYGGSGPADLALSILADYLGDVKLAERCYQAFKWDFVAKWTMGQPWKLTGAEIHRWLTENLAAQAPRFSAGDKPPTGWHYTAVCCMWLRSRLSTLWMNSYMCRREDPRIYPENESRQPIFRSR